MLPQISAMDINIVCMVAHSVLEGLTYRYDDVQRIIQAFGRSADFDSPSLFNDA